MDQFIRSPSINQSIHDEIWWNKTNVSHSQSRHSCNLPHTIEFPGAISKHTIFNNSRIKMPHPLRHSVNNCLSCFFFIRFKIKSPEEETITLWIHASRSAAINHHNLFSMSSRLRTRLMCFDKCELGLGRKLVTEKPKNTTLRANLPLLLYYVIECESSSKYILKCLKSPN